MTLLVKAAALGKRSVTPEPRRLPHPAVREQRFMPDKRLASRGEGLAEAGTLRPTRKFGGPLCRRREPRRWPNPRPGFEVLTQRPGRSGISRAVTWGSA